MSSYSQSDIYHSIFSDISCQRYLSMVKYLKYSIETSPEKIFTRKEPPMSSYSQSDIYHSIFSDIYTQRYLSMVKYLKYSIETSPEKIFTRKEPPMSSYSQSDIYHSIFSDIYTVFCGMQDCTPSYSFGPAVRDCYLLHLCLKGEGVFYSGEERYLLKQGQGFLIHPGKLTFYQADDVNPWSYLWVGIGGHDAEKYLRLLSAQTGTGVSHSSGQTDILSGR